MSLRYPRLTPTHIVKLITAEGPSILRRLPSNHLSILISSTKGFSLNTPLPRCPLPMFLIRAPFKMVHPFLRRIFSSLFTYHLPPGSLTPLRQYERLINSGVLRGDEHQTRIIQKLQDLHDKLVDYNPPPVPEEGPANSLVSQSASPFPLIPIIDPVQSLFASPSSLGSSAENHQHQRLHQRVPRKGYTFTAMSALARQCSWIYSTKHCPLP